MADQNQAKSARENSVLQEKLKQIVEIEKEKLNALDQINAKNAEIKEILKEKDELNKQVNAYEKSKFLAEGWHRVEHVFKNYPAGMRYLTLTCLGSDGQFWASHYGVKLANCSVKAVCEMNAE